MLFKTKTVRRVSAASSSCKGCFKRCQWLHWSLNLGPIRNHAIWGVQDACIRIERHWGQGSLGRQSCWGIERACLIGTRIVQKDVAIEARTDRNAIVKARMRSDASVVGQQVSWQSKIAWGSSWRVARSAWIDQVVWLPTSCFGTAIKTWEC